MCRQAGEKRDDGDELPGPFLRWGEFNLKTLVVPLFQLIMFVMGTRVSLRGLRQVWGESGGVLVCADCCFSGGGGVLFERVLRRRQEWANAWLPWVVNTTTCFVNGLVRRTRRRRCYRWGGRWPGSSYCTTDWGIWWVMRNPATMTRQVFGRIQNASGPLLASYLRSKIQPAVR